MTYVITDICHTYLDTACVSSCPVDAIYRGPDQYHIDPDECICCAACVWVCPVNAIHYIDDVPDGFTLPELPQR